MISASDIVFTLSGGATNTDPDESLGGDPSAFALTSGINNLYNDISKAECKDGHTDYRCIYVFNNNATDSFYNIVAALTPTAGGATKTFGVPIATDTQKIIVTGSITGGSFTLTYDPSDPDCDDDVTVNWSPITVVWSANLQNALNALPCLSGVVVTATAVAGKTTFYINFEGADNYKQHPLLTLKTSALLPSSTIVISKMVDGGPINNIASTIPNDLTVPAGITFGATDINIGTLNHGDGFPVWIKRSIAAGSTGVYGDGLNLKIDGSPI